MVRTILAAALVVGVLPLASASAEPSHATIMRHHHRHHMMMEHHRRRNCGHMSHGTGYHGCGTATGGPVGGLPSRN